MKVKIKGKVCLCSRPAVAYRSGHVFICQRCLDIETTMYRSTSGNFDRKSRKKK